MLGGLLLWDLWVCVLVYIYNMYVPLPMAYLLYDMVESCVEFPSLAIKVGQYFESTLEQIEAQKNIIDKFQ